MHIGLELALTGMGTVFTFLVVLIFVTTLMSRLVLKYEQSRFSAESKKTNPVKKHVPSSGHSNNMPPELLTAVISAAIHKHRTRQSERSINRD